MISPELMEVVRKIENGFGSARPSGPAGNPVAGTGVGKSRDFSPSMNEINTYFSNYFVPLPKALQLPRITASGNLGISLDPPSGVNKVDNHNLLIWRWIEANYAAILKEEKTSREIGRALFAEKVEKGLQDNYMTEDAFRERNPEFFATITAPDLAVPGATFSVMRNGLLVRYFHRSARNFIEQSRRSRER